MLTEQNWERLSIDFNIVEDFQSNTLYINDTYQEVFDSKIWIQLNTLIASMKYYLEDLFTDKVLKKSDMSITLNINDDIIKNLNKIFEISFDDIIDIFETFNCLMCKNFYKNNNILKINENIEKISMKLFHNLIALINFSSKKYFNKPKPYVVNNESLQVSLIIRINNLNYNIFRKFFSKLQIL